METKTGVELIAEERKRQIESEDWSPNHDDGHSCDELAIAGACYALPKDLREKPLWNETLVERLWPFGSCEWNPKRNRVRDLVRAGALIAAEIDRIHRRKEKERSRERE